ncbi:MAG TPA: prenyltransferase/squalene oxidase repeat-containing protein [Thermoanaerobaculia bacterium]|nr:prenyltransferase/squalene oxidase repeat-containing protein [Thermoanaerobaculia bacterium]
MPTTSTLPNAAARLLASRGRSGGWEGELSSSALSTATASCALELRRRALGEGLHAPDGVLVRRGLEWLARHQNSDGGWGDTPDSPSNASTTLLCWVALGTAPERAERHRSTLGRAEAWLSARTGGLSADALASHIVGAYGEDRTFSVPILTMCALGGRLGAGRATWSAIEPLPFELAAIPRRWLGRVGLPMVSYALPALIAIGQVRHHNAPPRNPFIRLIRDLARRRTLQVLRQVQPESGGFLEATPLTSFVVMSLVGSGLERHPVAEKGARFLTVSVRGDGSWPIDSNLSTWLTTLAVNALGGGGRLDEYLPAVDRARLLDRVLGLQQQGEHPYTGAAPGGWAWTDLSGGVPDADDTAGALLALWTLAEKDAAGRIAEPRLAAHAGLGVRWLLALQNADGGIPTFCRGWGRLPFDRSGPDLTAHALRAWWRWRASLPALAGRIESASRGGVRFLLRSQTETGAWIPLWFGNQHEPRLENPLYGTARVLLAGSVELDDPALEQAWRAAVRRGLAWILDAQNRDGGWGGGPASPSSIEETALAVEALASFAGQASRDVAPAVTAAIERAAALLDAATVEGTHFPPAPIGLYFARLWYSERLYPLIWSVAALERLRAREQAAGTTGPGDEAGWPDASSISITTPRLR